MYPASFEYVIAHSIDEAVQLLVEHGGEAKLLAGGHSLVPMMKLRLVQPRYVVDIGRLPGLRGVSEEDDQLVIGALTRHADLAAAPVREQLPVLAQAAGQIGDIQVRNRGTIGGSVVHADPGADLPVALSVLGATLIAIGPRGTRRIPVAEAFVDIFTSGLAEDEVLTAVRVPWLPAGAGSAYRKLPHPASGYVVVSCAVVVLRDPDGRCREARVALGGMGGTPLRATATEQILQGHPLEPDQLAAAASHAADDADPLDELYAPAAYKAHMATVLAREALEAALADAGRDRPTRGWQSGPPPP